MSNREVIEWLRKKAETTPPAEHGTNLASLGTDCSEFPNNSDTISRQAAIDALRNYLVGKNVPCDGTLTCRLIENEVINKLPSAEPKRGKWIDNGEAFICSECRSGYKEQPTLMGKPMFEFCPMCGAKMEVNNESN